MRKYNTLVAFALFGMLTVPAQAQSAGQDMLHAQLRNQLGVIKYCVAKGFPSQPAADRYEKFLKSLPAPKDAAKVAAAEEKGRKGNYFYTDPDFEMPVEQFAEGQGQTLEQHCKTFDDRAKALTGG